MQCDSVGGQYALGPHGQADVHEYTFCAHVGCFEVANAQGLTVSWTTSGPNPRPAHVTLKLVSLHCSSLPQNSPPFCR